MSTGWPDEDDEENIKHILKGSRTRQKIIDSPARGDERQNFIKDQNQRKKTRASEKVQK